MQHQLSGEEFKTESHSNLRGGFGGDMPPTALQRIAHSNDVSVGRWDTIKRQKGTPDIEPVSPGEGREIKGQHGVPKAKRLDGTRLVATDREYRRYLTEILLTVSSATI